MEEPPPLSLDFAPAHVDAASRRRQRAVLACVGAKLMQDQRKVQSGLGWECNVRAGRRNLRIRRVAQCQLLADESGKVCPGPGGAGQQSVRMRQRPDPPLEAADESQRV